MKALLALAVLVLLPLADRAQAANYPLSGRWTYDNAQAPGPAKPEECRGKAMEFRGERRFDDAGSVRDFRNVTLNKSGATTYQGTDEFTTGQITAQSNYTLQILDADHIAFEQSGRTAFLRRCQ